MTRTIGTFKEIAIIITCIILSFGLKSQNRWTKTYFEGENPYGESIIEYYDKGYLLAGRYGPNYPEFNWLVKTDVNGELIWNKVIGHFSNSIVISDGTDSNREGDIFLVGSTSFYAESYYDPLIMKLNACGEKEWCKVFYEEGLNYAEDVIALGDGGCVAVLRYMNVDLVHDRICLTKFNSVGDMHWKQCYNSLDTNIHNQEAQNLIMTPDKGFLITGYCSYASPDPPHSWYYKPYYIKTDSSGNFEWETVVHSEITDKGGHAWTTTIDPDSNNFYSSITHKYYSSRADYAPALLKMDFTGNIIDIYDFALPNSFGTMIEAKFITDTSLAASVTSGGANTHPKAVIIDTLGNIIKQTTPLENDWIGHVEITFDNKVLYQTNMNDGDVFDTYLFKLNQSLESDTIYTQIFTYDSLCDGEIVSDTIVQDDCGIIVGMEEIYRAKSEIENKILIYPNPARDKFTVSSQQSAVSSWRIEVYDLFGRKVDEMQVTKGQTKIEVNTIGWKKGLYVIKVRNKIGMIGSGKVILD